MSVQLAEQPEQSEQPEQPEPGESVGYVVTLLLNAAGARLLSEESGHPYRANQEGELHFEAVDYDDLIQQAREYGHVIRIKPEPGQNAQALKDATALVIQIREQPYVFADRYLALTRAVTELQVQAKRAADYAMASREEAARQLRELDAAHEMRLDSMERIVASYETIIRHQEWLAEQHGAD